MAQITKLFTATLLSDMAQRGEVKREDPVARFLPTMVQVPARGQRQIELVDLATSTSGLPRLPANWRPGDAANPLAGSTVEEPHDFRSASAVPREAGAEYEDSNAGSAGHALALRAGMSWEELLRDRILGPLGMTMTGITLRPAMTRRFALPHDDELEIVICAYQAGDTLPQQHAVPGQRRPGSSASLRDRFARARVCRAGGLRLQAREGQRTHQCPVTGQQDPGRLTLVCHNSPAIAVAFVLALLAAGHGILAVVGAVRVLIVDDQQPFRAAARKVVEMTAGFEVAGEAETEEGSVRMAAELDPDLVLMDVNLAGVSAREATRRILNWSDRVVVFLLSTYEATEYASWAAGCGAAAYITKAELDPRRLARAWEEAAPRRPGRDTSPPA